MGRDTKRKICIYCEKWTLGGIEAFLIETITHMDRQGLEIHLALSEPPSSAFYRELRDAGVAIHALQKRSGLGSFKRTMHSLYTFHMLLKKERFDVVHLNIFHGAALIFAWLARRAGVPTIIAHSHGAGLRKSKGYYFKLAAHYLCRTVFSGAPTVRWAASVRAGKFLFPSGSGVAIIPNGIHTERFLFSEAHRNVVRRELGIQNAYVIGCVGRLENQKNQMFLLDILSKCLETRPACALLLVGDGEDRQALEAKADWLGIGGAVRFLGKSEHVPDLMCAMDVLAMPSVSEGFGIAAVEAQASGLPVVCSTGVPEEVQITEAAVFLPLSAEKDQWVEALLSQQPLDRIRQNSLVRQSKFQIETSAEIVRKGYEGDEEPFE